MSVDRYVPRIRQLSCCAYMIEVTVIEHDCPGGRPKSFSAQVRMAGAVYGRAASINVHDPPPNVGAGGGLMSLLSPLYPRGPLNLGKRLRELPVQDASVDFPHLASWRVIHTPGHTPGHVSFFRSGDRTLLVGDAFCTTKPESFFEAALVQQPELHGPPAYFTSDWEQAGQSVRALADLNPLIVAPGHGKPLAGEDVPVALNRLAAEFGEVAVPRNQKRIA